MIPKNILIVDDSEELTDALGEFLTAAGFNVSVAHDGECMKNVLSQVTQDLIILDINLPGDDGFTLCSHIRKKSDIPIIMLTAANSEIDRVTGLEVGADDYVTKAFSPRELLARIKALFRRSEMREKTSEQKEFHFNQWVFTPVLRVVCSPQGLKTKLSGADCALLSLFLQNKNKILSRDKIAIAIWGRTIDPFERGIDVQISRLRNHLQDRKHQMIVTIRHQGYLFSDNEL